MARNHALPQIDVLILDSGAVLALAAHRPEAEVALNQARLAGTPVLVPAVVVAEVARGDGPRDAPVNRVLNTAAVVPVTEVVARVAGRLLAVARSAATVDALVVAEGTQHRQAAILTSDPHDLSPLAAPHPHRVVQAV